MIRSKSRLVFRTGAFLAVCLVCLTSAEAQTWTKIGVLSSDVYCAYFWDTAHGVVGGHGFIYTYNSGAWTKSNYPEQTGDVYALRILKPGLMYAAQGQSQIWVSSDSGKNWHLTGIVSQFASDLYLTKDSTIHVVSAWPGEPVGGGHPGFYLEGGGTFARLDSNICILTHDDSGLVNFSLSVPISYSHDGGKTWSDSKIIGQDQMGGFEAYADTCSKVFYAAMEDGPVYRSTDSGITWRPPGAAPFGSLTDIMDGADGTIYQETQAGVFRSSDGGCSWNSLGGPEPSDSASGDEDVRIFVFGNHGCNIVAFSRDSVFLLAGVKDSEYNPPSPIIIDNFVGDCSIHHLSIDLEAQGCYPLNFQLHFSTSPGLSVYPNDTSFRDLPDTTITLQLTLDSAAASGRSQLNITTTAVVDCKIYLWHDSLIIQRVPHSPNLSSVSQLTLGQCQIGRIPVVIRAPACQAIRLDSIVCDSSLLLLSSGFVPPDTLLPWQTDTIWVSVKATHPGQRVFNVHCYLYCLGQNLPYDTVLSLSVTVPPVAQGEFVAAPPIISMTNCKTSFVPIFFYASPCDSLEFSSCTLTIDNSLKYTTNLTFARMLAAGDEDTLLINFPAQNLNGTYIISAHVTGKYSGSYVTFDTTVQIRVTFTSSSGALAANLGAIDLDTLSLCSQRDTLVMFSNLGCDSITVMGDGTVWQPGWSADDPAFPFKLAPDSSFTVRVHFRPASPAWSEQFLRYGFENIGGQIDSSLPFAMTVTAVPVAASLSLSDTALDFGTLSRCSAVGDMTITLTNSSCDSLAISGVTIDPGEGFTLASGSDTSLAPNETARFAIHFADSITGTLASAIRIHAIGAHGGNSIDTIIPLSAVIVGGKTALSADTTPRDFGALFECEERDTTIWLHNPGCDTLRVDSAVFSNASYSPDTTFPIFIPPDSSVPVKVHLTGSANMDGAVTFYSDANTGQRAETVPLRASLLHPATLRLVVVPSDSAAGGLTVMCYVMLEGQIPAGLISALHFDITHNDDLLSFLNASGAGLSLVNTSPKSGIITQSFLLSPIPNSDTIGTLKFQVYLTDSTSTPLSLSNISFTTSRDLPLDCIASIVDTGAQFTYLYRCGDHILQNFMLNGQMPFSIESIVPNPATASLRVEGRGQRVEVELDDALGRNALPSTLYALPFTLDASSLPSGTYFLRLSENGYVQTRQISIEH